MQISDMIALIAVALSLLAFVYSIINNVRQNKYIKTQDELNGILLHKEKKSLSLENKAQISATFVRYGPKDKRIRVYNKGDSRATNVNIEFLEDPNWLIMDDIFPLEFLDSGDSVELIVSLHMQSSRKAKCKLTWMDISGENEIEVILTT